MSGVEVASAVELIKIAGKTASLIKRVYKAHENARDLNERIQELLKLVKHVHHVLEKRQRLTNALSATDEDRDTQKNIESSLNSCHKCLMGISKELEPLLTSERSPQLRDRIRYVLKQDFIDMQDRKISKQLESLSVLLQCLLCEDQIDTRRDQFILRDELLVLLRYVLHYAALAASERAQDTSTDIHNNNYESVGPLEVPTIENENSETLTDLLQRDLDRSSSFSRFRFPSSPRIEEITDEVSATDNEADSQTRDNQLLSTTQTVVDQEISTADSHHLSDLELDRPLSADMEEYTQRTTLHLAIKRNEVDLVRNLIREGADPAGRDQHRWTHLQYAVFRLRSDIVGILLDHPACREESNINAQTPDGETALIFAVQNAHEMEGYQIAARLIELNCDVNISDRRGPALYHLISRGRPSNRPRQSLVQLLVDHGADVQAVDKQHPGMIEDYKLLRRHMSQSENHRDSIAEDSEAIDDNAVRSERSDSNQTSGSRPSTMIRRLFSRTRRLSSQDHEVFGSSPPP